MYVSYDIYILSHQETKNLLFLYFILYLFVKKRLKGRFVSLSFFRADFANNFLSQKNISSETEKKIINFTKNSLLLEKSNATNVLRLLSPESKISREISKNEKFPKKRPKSEKSMKSLYRASNYENLFETFQVKKV